MNNKKLLIPAIGTAIALFAIAISALFMAPALRKPVIAYYRLPANVRAALSALADDPAFSGKTKFGIVVLDDTKGLAEQLAKKPRVDVVFAYDGAAAAATAGKALVPSEQLRLLLAAAIRGAGTRFGVGYALPILLDHFEVAYDAKAFGKAGFGEPRTLGDLIAGAQKTARPGVSPIACAGGNDRDLLLLVGAVAEAKYGLPAHDKIVADLREKGTLKSALANAELRGTLDTLVDWRKKGILHPEWYRMKDADLTAFLDKGCASVAFMPFSTHRTIPLKTISRFSSIPFPPAQPGSARALTAPVIVGLLPSYRKPNAEAAEFLYRLAREEGQTILSANTGLVPVNSIVPAQDIQANDVRFWVASSNGPRPDPASAAFADPAKIAETARDVRAYIEANNTGF
ncbi:MAG TPA: extracellular solute-binding protein [Treponemataceae bacterium]|nr:extracellular solute-binding protein [Treponemataceae bacterium]